MRITIIISIIILFISCQKPEIKKPPKVIDVAPKLLPQHPLR